LSVQSSIFNHEDTKVHEDHEESQSVVFFVLLRVFVVPAVVVVLAVERV